MLSSFSFSCSSHEYAFWLTFQSFDADNRPAHWSSRCRSELALCFDFSRSSTTPNELNWINQSDLRSFRRPIEPAEKRGHFSDRFSFPSFSFFYSWRFDEKGNLHAHESDQTVRLVKYKSLENFSYNLTRVFLAKYSTCHGFITSPHNHNICQTLTQTTFKFSQWSHHGFGERMVRRSENKWRTNDACLQEGCFSSPAIVVRVVITVDSLFPSSRRCDH